MRRFCQLSSNTNACKSAQRFGILRHSQVLCSRYHDNTGTPCQLSRHACRAADPHIAAVRAGPEHHNKHLLQVSDRSMASSGATWYLFQDDKPQFVLSKTPCRGQHGHPRKLNCGQVRHVAEILTRGVIADVLRVVWRKKRSAVETGWKVDHASELHCLPASPASRNRGRSSGWVIVPRRGATIQHL